MTCSWKIKISLIFHFEGFLFVEFMKNSISSRIKRWVVLDIVFKLNEITFDKNTLGLNSNIQLWDFTKALWHFLKRHLLFSTNINFPSFMRRICLALSFSSYEILLKKTISIAIKTNLIFFFLFHYHLIIFCTYTHETRQCLVHLLV